MKSASNTKNALQDSTELITELLRLCQKKGLLFLVLLYNYMLRFYHFPTHWKCSAMSMITKAGKPENPGASYRPVSLLPIFTKIFKRIFLNRMIAVSCVQDAIPDHQFGFQN